jgi:hypothetical protein
LKVTELYYAFLFAEILYTKVTQLKPKVDVSDGGDAMEE